MHLLSRPSERKATDSVVQFSQPFTAQPHFMMAVGRGLASVPHLALTIPIIIDSTGIPPNFPSTFEFPKSMWEANKLDQIKQVLSRYGMCVTIEDQNGRAHV